MAKLSRTEKYREFRESLQNDVGQELDTRDLNHFQDRLNQIDPNNFEAPKSTNSANLHDPIHARRVEVTQEPVNNEPEPIDNGDTIDMSLHFDHSDPFAEQEPSFSNDYLDRYINEVKQYNIDQGNAVSENTQVNILNRMKLNNDTAPSSPYPDDRRSVGTTEVPFINSNVTPNNTRRDYSHPQGQPAQRTVNDISREVQSLVDTDGYDTIPEVPEEPATTTIHTSSMSTSEFNKHLEMERTTRQQLLNETTQMRAQLDDYEDNLSDFSDKMRHTNQVLNIVLIILIIALVIILGMVIYWIMH